MEHSGGAIARAILFDMDGVLYVGETIIAGAAETMRWVREQRIPHLFVTNTSTHGRAYLKEKLQRLGIAASEGDIFTPAVAAAGWLREHASGPVALFVQATNQAEFAGLHILPQHAETGAHYVVIGDLEEGWNFRTLNRAFRLLHSNPMAQLIALGMTRYWLAEDGMRLDVAPFVAALEHATGRKPTVFGKPGAAFFYAAAARLGIPCEEILMIGDDIETDIAGAQRAGLKAALVRSGKFQPADLERGVTPDVVLASIRSLPEWWSQAK
jgi:HAD superfamily hydrolase (TIGR01458 family)